MDPLNTTPQTASGSGLLKANLAIPTRPLARTRLRHGRTSNRRRPSVLTRYLTGMLVLLAVVLALTPPAAPVERPGRAPAHQVEAVDVRGGGVNTLTRWTLRAAAWSTAQAVDRQGDLLTPSPLVTRLLGPLAHRFGAWRNAHTTALLPVVLTAIVLLVLAGTLTCPVQPRWLLVLGLVLLWSTTACHPRAVLRAASLPGETTTGVVVALAGPATPGGADPQAAQRQLAEQLWTALVTQPHSRVQTGSAVLAQAPPEQRTGLLNTLSRQINSIAGRVNGDHALERAITGVVALAAAVVAAVVVTVCSMLGWLAQSLLFALCLTAVVLFPLLVSDARARRLWPRWLLYPAFGAALVTALGTLGSVVAAKVAVALAGSGEALARLLPGSVLVLVALAVGVIAARRGRRLARRITTTSSRPPAGLPAQADASAPGTGGQAA